MSFPVRARDGALDALRRAGLLVLDVDGVLLDPRPSFYRAAQEVSLEAATRALGRPPGPAVTDEEIGAFKAVGGFNDDFELAAGCAWALVAREAARTKRSVSEWARLSAGGGLGALLEVIRPELPQEVLAATSRACDPAAVRERCAARYSGRSRCMAMYGIDPDAHPDLPDGGLWDTESILCNADALRSIQHRLALFTGRNRGEAELALERLGLRVDSAMCVVDDGTCPRKPEPEGLLRLAATANTPLAFVGDSVDDQRAVLAYRERSEGGLPPATFVRVLGSDASDEAIEEALRTGADVVVSSLDDVLHLFTGADHG